MSRDDRGLRVVHRGAGSLIPLGVTLRETVIDLHDRVCLEGNNRGQADIMAPALPKKVTLVAAQAAGDRSFHI